MLKIRRISMALKRIAIVFLPMIGLLSCVDQGDDRFIKVGVLHSMTGTMARSERAVVDATLLAIEEINKKGGLLDRKILPVLSDGQSDWGVFAEKAEELISEEKVKVVFGCWTSACRKNVKPIFEKHNHLLFYPVQYEGMEMSKNIVYTGATPNQQIVPAIKWVSDNIGKRIYLVGSDYIFPHVANRIVKDVVDVLGGEVVGEKYISLGSEKVDSVIDDIVKHSPDVVINTINGDSNVSFFSKLRTATKGRKFIPTMSFSIAENEITAMSELDLSGHFASWNYFQSIQTQDNKQFVERFRDKYGSHRTISDPMQAAYVGVKLWAKSVRLSRTDEPSGIRESVSRQSYAAPQGLVSVDIKTQHLWKRVRIGRINKDRQFDIVWESRESIRPVPFPSYKTPKEWQEFQTELYEKWGNRWESPS